VADKPAVVLVHGFWGDGAHWAGVIVELSRRGYTSLYAVENPLTSLADDAERTRKMVNQIDGPVVLVGHSYGGAVITESGDLPNVKALVYVAAFAPQVDESLGSCHQLRSITPHRTPMGISGLGKTNSARVFVRTYPRTRHWSWP
jgi:pimeloyl-ACP methyl ester carboxylesterase